MLFPFFFLALSLAGGILFSSFLSPSLVTGISSMVVCLICAWFFHLSLRKTKASFVLTLLATFFLGSSLFTYQTDSFENNPLRKLKTEGYIDFQGRLYKSPSRGRDRDYLYLKVEKISTGNREQSASGNLRILVPHSQQASMPIELHTQDKIEVSAKLSLYRGYRNFGSAAADQYIRTQNIHRRAFTKSSMLVHKLEDGKKTSFPRLVSQIRRKLQLGIEHHFSDPHDSRLSAQGAVVEAILLGERGRMDPEISYGLQNSGIFHLFAISGAHIAIISFFLFSLFRLIRFPDRLNYVLLIVFLILYASLVEGRPSVMRATIMALAFLIGKLIWRNVNLLNTFSVSAFILLMLNPYSLFSLGFQLTFAATLSIILFYPKIIKYLPRLPLRISEIFALSLTAQMAVLPFIALAFNRITFSGLILNFAAIPLVGLIMASGYIFLLTGLLSTLLAGFLAKFIHFQVSVLIATSHLLDSIPAVSYRTPTPFIFVVLGYFVSLGLFLLPIRRKRQKLFTSVCFALFLGLLVTYPFPSRANSLKLTFIDVGQGDSILVEFPGTKKMLIDGGGIPEDTYDIGDRVVSRFLWDKGIKKVHYLVLTHAHPDHLKGLKAVARNFKIGEFWETFSPKDNLAYAELIKRLPAHLVRKRMFRGHSVKIDDVTVEVLNPPQGDPIVSDIHNDQSLVLRISCGQTAFLLTSDIGKKVEKELVRSSSTLQSDVLKSPHHGSDSSSSEEFLKAIAPRHVILSVGGGNRYGLPDTVVIDRYQGINAQIYRTDRMGAVEISSDGKKLSIRTASGSPQLSGYRK